MEAKGQQEIEFNRFGYIAAIILLIGCLGGIAVGVGAIQNTFSLILVVIPTMITLSLLLAVSPMKYIMKASLVCITIDVLMIAYYTIF
jgi:hypothetical protein